MTRQMLALVALAAAAGAHAQEVDGRAKAQLLRKPYVSTVTGKERDYFLFLPIGHDTEKGKLWPVILFLHGGGERGDGKGELDSLLKHGPLKEAWAMGRDLPFIMISPQMPSRQTPQPAPARPQPAKPPAQPGMAREITGAETDLG